MKMYGPKNKNKKKYFNHIS